ERGVLPLDHDSVDDAFVIRRWLALASGSGSVAAIDERPDWTDLTGRMLAIPLDELPADFASLGGSAEGDPEDDPVAIPEPAAAGGGPDRAAVYSLSFPRSDPKSRRR
ncbi:MAG: hypothetical protein ACKOWF_15680, partial [Chloroflexota bacterium]